jgi:hypothetical protein
MKAPGLSDGTIGVWDMQRNCIVPNPAGEPDENQELYMVEDGEWVPYRDITEREKKRLDALAFLDAARDILEEL